MSEKTINYDGDFQAQGCLPTTDYDGDFQAQGCLPTTDYIKALELLDSVENILSGITSTDDWDQIADHIQHLRQYVSARLIDRELANFETVKARQEQKQ